MRIGIITATYLPSKNGVATSTALFARGLRAAGHEVRIFAPEHPQGVTGDEVGVHRLPSTTLAAPPDYPLLLPLTAAVTSRLPLADLDVIHTMHPFLAGQVALRWARSLGVPLVFTAHTQYHQYVHYARMSRRFSRWLVRRHVRTFARAVDEVLVPGRAMEEVLRRYGYRGDVTYMANPVDLAAFQGESGGSVRARLGIPAHAPLLVNVGRLAPEKNLKVLLESFALARTLVPGLRLLLVGDGPSRVALQQRGLEAVHFAGAVEHARVPGYLAAADGFLTASTSEILPMSMIEALAAGVPLIAARSPAAEELVRDGVNGVLCEAAAQDLAQGVARVLRGGQLDAFREGAVAGAAAYDVTNRARELLAVYERLIAGRAANRAA